MIAACHACPAMRFRHRDENPVTATPLDSAFTNCDGRKSFIFCIYESCRVCTNNSYSGTHDASPQEIAALSFHSLTNCPFFPREKHPLCFHALTNCPFRKFFVFTFMHRMGGVGGRPQAYLKKNFNCGRLLRGVNYLQRADFTSYQPPVTDSQCKKCRIPVNTIPKPSRSAAAITSASRTEPPGWITAVAPALAASSTPSGNGKKASEATTLPASGDCAFITASFTESTRLICPAPTPSVAPSFAKTIALDFTCFATFHAKRIVCSSFGIGGRFVTVRNSLSWISPRSGCCTSIPPRTRFSCSSRSGSRPPGGNSSNRRFFFVAKMALDFSSKPGAAMHSTKSFATSSAVAASTTRLNARTPPNADTGSHASAFRYASRKVPCSAVPHGLLCLMITAAGSENSAARLRAASRSTKLLYESSLPWSCFAAASPSGFLPAGTYSAAAWCGFSPYRNSCCRRRATCTRSGSTGLAPRETFSEAAANRSNSVVISPSYREVVANTLRASSSRVASVVSPALSSSFATRSKSSGSVTTVTLSKFFAAERSIVGPPISMFSINSSAVSPAFAAVASNGYRFTTTKSIGAMPCSAACFRSSAFLRRKRIPPCTFGCRVFTRPPSISGQPVKSETSRTLTPASRSNFAVPPVERISIFSTASRFANSTIPVLSNTLISARSTAIDSSENGKAEQCTSLARIGEVHSLWETAGKIYDFTSAFSLTWPSTVSSTNSVKLDRESFPVCSPACCFACKNAWYSCSTFSVSRSGSEQVMRNAFGSCACSSSSFLRRAASISFAAAPKWRWTLPSSFAAVFLRKMSLYFAYVCERLLKRNRCANFSSPPRSA